MYKATQIPTVRQKPPKDPEKTEAEAFARLFLGCDDGERVLRWLRAKYPADAPRFPTPSTSALEAARIDGSSGVVTDILRMIDSGTPRSIKPTK